MWDLRQWDAHKQRLLTGVLLLAGLFLVLLRGPFWSWCLLVAVAATIGLSEFQGLVFSECLHPPWQILYLVMGAVLPGAAVLGGPVGLHFALVVGLFGGFLVYLIRSPSEPKMVAHLARFALGWLYVPYLLSYALLLGVLDKGRCWIFLVLVIIIAGDVGAFYGGRRWGKRKLYPSVSPKKTCEGALVGLLASVVLSTLYAVLFLREVPVTAAPIFGLMVGAVGQIGDLIESMLKRLCGKKDSSNLLPGHGGLLDRLDSLLFAFPTTWFLRAWLM
jgi:phosphatidate cytidylyltransferase